mgnify:CR=1 FL=1
MNIELLPFQRFAIADLQNAVESGHKEIILKILVENSTNEKVGREVGYTKSGIWYKVMQDIKRIL